MQQDSTTQMIEPESTAYVTFHALQREIGTSTSTLKKYLTYLDIERICFHTDTHSLSILHEVKRLKQSSVLLAQLLPPVIAHVISARKDTSDAF